MAPALTETHMETTRSQASPVESSDGHVKLAACSNSTLKNVVKGHLTNGNNLDNCHKHDISHSIVNNHVSKPQDGHTEIGQVGIPTEGRMDPPSDHFAKHDSLMPDNTSKSLINNNTTPVTINNSKQLPHNSIHSSHSIVSESTMRQPNTLTKVNFNSIHSSLLMLDNLRQRAKIMELTEDVIRKQSMLKKRAKHLMQRVHYLQATHQTEHVSEQLSGFVDSQLSCLQCMAKSIKSNADMQQTGSLLPAEDMKNLSTSALVSLVRQLQYSQVTLRQRLSSCDSENSSVLTLDKTLCSEIEKTSSVLHMNLKRANEEIDEYATDSSDDESECEPRDDILMSVKGSCDWKWSDDRSAIASRWTWMQAQVSDLEYRIRQQTDIARQIRTNKGSLVLGEQSLPDNLLHQSVMPAKKTSKLSPIEQKIANIEKRNELSPCNISSLLSNVDKQSTKLTQSLGNCYSPLNSPQSQKNKSKLPIQTANGLVEGCSHPEINSEISPDSDPAKALDSSYSASRCRPTKSYRKRKLLFVDGIQAIGGKMAKMNSIRCNCMPQLGSCVLCRERKDPTRLIDPYGKRHAENVALLDYSCHSKLSFKHEIPQAIYFEKMIKVGDWQNQSTSGVSRLIKKKQKADPDSNSKKYMRSKYAKKFIERKRIKMGLSKSHDGSLRYKSKNSRKFFNKSADMKRRRAKQLALVRLRKQQNSLLANQMFGNFTNLSQSSPAGLMYLHDRRRHSMPTAYDIDNIVIPYSMASSTRMEKLSYKEIPTPGWREVAAEDAKMSDAAVKQPEDENEELSDECYTARHARCEILEKKRFITYKELSNRSSVQKQSEDRVATPDPLSKEMIDSQPQLTTTSRASVATPNQYSATNDWQPSQKTATDSVAYPPNDIHADEKSNCASLYAPGTPLPYVKDTKEAFLSNYSLSDVSSLSDSMTGEISDPRKIHVNPGAPSLLEYIKADIEPWFERGFPLSDEAFDELSQEPRPATPQQCNTWVSMGIGNHTGAMVSQDESMFDNTDVNHVCDGDTAGYDSENDPEWTVIDEDQDVEEKIVLKLAKSKK